MRTILIIILSVTVGFLLDHYRHILTKPPTSITPIPVIIIEEEEPERHIQVLPDIAYTDSENPKHNLDIYQPIENNTPVVIFIHGGAWNEGDSNHYGFLGQFFAQNNITFVSPSYRLTNEVQCDGEVQDVIKAIQWTQHNIKNYGGDPNKIYLMGHSSGAHLISLITVKNQVDNIQGVICLSGVYKIGWTFQLSGVIAQAFQGLDREKYSPINYVHQGLPPFLIFYAEHDLTTLPSQSKKFHQALRNKSCNSELNMVDGEDHKTEIINLVLPKAKSGQRIVDFVK